MRYAIASLAAAAWTPMAQAQSYGGGSYHGHMWEGGNGIGYGLLGGGLLLLLLISIVLATVLALRWISDTNASRAQGDRSLDILKERLAKGEIDAEEYALRKKALQE